MRIIAISDTHMLHQSIKLPEGDLLIHAGDALNYGKKEELFLFSKWWNELSFEKKIFVPGNHDWCFERDLSWARTMLLNTHTLVDQGAEIDNVSFYGSPWQPIFCDWAFNREDFDRRRKFAVIPEVDVLITHAPPKGYCDMLGSTHLGDGELASAINSKIPRIHICGHIHAGAGRQTRGSRQTVYNVAICNEQYKPVNPVTIIDL